MNEGGAQSVISELSIGIEISDPMEYMLTVACRWTSSRTRGPMYRNTA